MYKRALLAIIVGPYLAFTSAAALIVPAQTAVFGPGLGNRFDGIILRHAIARRVDPRLVKAIIAVESEFYPLAVSSKGALGLMQLMPSTGAEVGVAPEHLRDPEANIRAGTAYLRLLSNVWRTEAEAANADTESRLDPPLDRLVAAYHAGPKALALARWSTATRLYVSAVLRYYRSDRSALRSIPVTRAERF